MRIILNKILFLILLFGTAGQIFADEIVKAEINPLNKAMIYLSGTNSEFQTSLSPDKLNITVKIPGCNISKQVKDLSGKGIISDVYFGRSGDTAVINIILKDKRGYTASILPYSNILFVEIFKWDKIDKAEDNYRQGLLALEDALYPAAKPYFEKSAAAGYAESSFFLGVILLKEGFVNKAEKALNEALNQKAWMPDVYAGLAQVYAMNGNTEKSAGYRKLFEEKTGLKSIKDIRTGVLDIPDSSDESLSFLDRSQGKINDSLIKASDSTAADTSAKARSDSIIILDKTEPHKSGSGSILPEWFSTIFIYVLFFGGLIALMLLMTYFKWRKQRAGEIKKSKANFREKYKDAQKELSRNPQPQKKQEASKQENFAGRAHVANLYRKNEVKEKPATDKPVVNKEPVITPPEVMPEKQPETKKDIPDKKISPDKDTREDKKRKSLEDQFEQLEKELGTVDNKQKTEPDEEKINEKEEKKPVSPNVKLALKLKEELNKKKSQNIESLDGKELPPDESSLTEFSRKLGIEKSGLETKKNISKLKSDKVSLEKLSEKFNPKKEKNSPD